MNFDFSDDQKSLKDQANKFLTEKCTTKTVRKVFEGKESHDAQLWKAIGEMGWTGTAIPEAYGGLGLGYLELCVIAEEMGRALAPVPFSSTVYLFAEAVLAGGSEEQKKKYLADVAAGRLIGTFARAEGPGAVLPKTIRTTFKGGKLSGTKIVVVDGTAADYAVVLARSSDEAGERGLQLSLVDLKQPSVKRVVKETLDSSRVHADLIFDNANAEALGKPGEGMSLANRVLERAAILTAFE